MLGLPPPLVTRAREAAGWVAAQRREGRTITVVHHVDADGVTGGAIALEALHRAGIAAVGHVVKSLDDLHIQGIQAAGPEALWFTDLGSAAYMHFDQPRLVCDHHELVRDGTEETFAHVNPKLDDLPGSSISGAGTTFLVALAMDEANIDLLPLALVGAAADLQDRAEPGFHGANARLLEEGVARGLLEVERDLAWFGLETRPLRKYFALAKDPVVPGATGDFHTAQAFLDHAGLRSGGTERTWADLDEAERVAVRSALVTRALQVGQGPDEVACLFRHVVRITAEAPGSPVRELQEYGTLLNSTARYGRPEVGLAVARGDRGAAYQEALSLLLDHRKHLVGALSAFRQAALTEAAHVQWVHLEDRVRDTVVGIVAGMALDGLRRDLPLLAFAHTPDGRTKASARLPGDLQGRLDLAVAMRAAAEATGGQGGGHAGAAGATFPRGQEGAFVAALQASLAAQKASSPHTL